MVNSAGQAPDRQLLGQYEGFEWLEWRKVIAGEAVKLRQIRQARRQGQGRQLAVSKRGQTCQAAQKGKVSKLIAEEVKRCEIRQRRWQAQVGQFIAGDGKPDQLG